MESQSATLRVETLPCFVPLLHGKRFKGASGGRGSGKSHFVAETIITDCLAGHQRVACIREFQSSIKDSVKRLLEDKIEKFNLGRFFRSTLTEITGPHESLIIFKGLQSTASGKFVESLKSLEGFTRAWAEEAQTLSAKSIETMTPTFRRGSEMYFTWNPNKSTDPVDKFFRENKDDPDFVWVHTSYRDNKWFPAELRRDMERDKRRDPDKYAHVWLGEYERRSEARIFRNWRIERFATPENTRFWFGADWGFGNPTTLIRCFIVGDKLYIDREAYGVNVPIEQTPTLFDQIPESRLWPICADSARPETIHFMKNNGFPRIFGAEKGPSSVEDGIEFLKGYDIVVHEDCEHVIDELSTYSYKIDRFSNLVLPVINKEAGKDHCIDAIRYALEGYRNSRMFPITDRFLDQVKHGGGVVTPNIVVPPASGIMPAQKPGFFGNGISDAFLSQLNKRGGR